MSAGSFGRWSRPLVFVPRGSRRWIAIRMARIGVRLAQERWVGVRRSLRRGGGTQTRFLLFGDGRMGSELLMSFLECHPRLRCDGEVLDLYLRSPADYVEGRAHLSETPVYGFKLLTYQLEAIRSYTGNPRFLEDLHRRGWRIVHMRREDPVRQAVSAMVAVQRRRFHRREGEAVDRTRFTLDPTDLLRRLESGRRRSALEREVLADLDHLTVTYEDDLLEPARHQATADRCFRFLGLDSVPVRTSLAKSTPRSLSDVVANLPEISLALDGTDYARWLDRRGGVFGLRMDDEIMNAMGRPPHEVLP